MTQPDRYVGPDGICHCGKLRYASRRIARKHARQLSLIGVAVYECGDWFHLGHLPRSVKKGKAGRAGIYHVEQVER